MDAHTATGVNREAARILVLMEVDGQIPRYSSSVHGELIPIVYWNPPLRCVRCVSFGHWKGQCKIVLEEPKLVRVDEGVKEQRRIGEVEESRDVSLEENVRGINNHADHAKLR